MPTRYLLTAHLSSFTHRLARGREGAERSLPRPYSFQGDTNDETANPTRTLFVHSVRCRGCFFGGGPGSVFERRKAQHARNSIQRRDRKSTRLNSSHGYISYAVFCLKKKKKNKIIGRLCNCYVQYSV